MRLKTRENRLGEMNVNECSIIAKFIFPSLVTPEYWMESREGTFSTAT